MNKYLKRRPITEGSFQAEDLLVKVKDWRGSIEYYSSTHKIAEPFDRYDKEIKGYKYDKHTMGIA